MKFHSLEDIRSTQRENIQSTLDALDNMHKDVAKRADNKRTAATESHNRKTNVRSINFTEGDFVLRGVMQHERTRKPSLKWIGPYRIIECRSEYIFLVEDLVNGKKQEVHGRRLKFFRNKHFQVSEELVNHLAYQTGELLVVEIFTDIRCKQDVTELQIKWRGFAEEESDWVSLALLREDVPELLDDYLQDIQKAGSRRQRIIAKSV